MNSFHLILFSSVIGCFLLGGCASSERMIRTSGGFIDEYSAPKSHRTRSERFQKGSAALGSPRDHVKELAGDSKEIVNVWPFFFKNRKYVSALWPMFDVDPYGWAIRPFYNQEGDDCSVLFPLSAWNTAGKDGWVLNCIFRPGFFSFFPLTWHSWSDRNCTLWYTPLLIHSRTQNEKPTRARLFISDSFTEFCLAYWGENKGMILPEKYQFLPRWDEKNWYKQNRSVLNYRLRKIGEPMPENEDAFKKYADAVFEKYAVEEQDTYWGFFPLFHTGRRPGSRNLSLLCELVEMKCSPGAFSFSAMGPLLGKYRSRETAENAPDNSWGTKFRSWCLLGGFEKEYFYRRSPADRSLNTLRRRSYESGFDVRGKSTLEELKKVHPDAAKNMPETVVDGATFQLYLDDLSKEVNREVGCNSDGGFVPLFYARKKDNGDFWWFSLPALSFYASDNNGNGGVFLPGLTWFRTSKTKDYSVIFAGLGSYCSVNRTLLDERYKLPVLPRSQKKWGIRGSRGKQKYEDQYYFMGLFYRGKDYFYVAKDGLNGDPEKLKQKIQLAVSQYRHLQEALKRCDERERHNKERVIKTKIDHYRQLIEEEEIKLAREKSEEERRKVDALTAEARTLAKALHFDLPEDFYREQKNVALLGNRIMDELAELRGYEDFGHGLLFRKEKFWNGDGNWKFLGFVAGGEKRGEYEKTHVLHLLYRYTRQGDKEETVCFPFIVRGREGQNSHFSFLWRVFDVEKKDGRTSGHILFLPFGN